MDNQPAQQPSSEARTRIINLIQAFRKKMKETRSLGERAMTERIEKTEENLRVMNRPEQEEWVEMIWLSLRHSVTRYINLIDLRPESANERRVDYSEELKKRTSIRGTLATVVTLGDKLNIAGRWQEIEKLAAKFYVEEYGQEAIVQLAEVGIEWTGKGSRRGTQAKKAGKARERTVIDLTE